MLRFFVRERFDMDQYIGRFVRFRLFDQTQQNYRFQARDSGILKEPPQGEFQSKGFANTRHHLRGEQGMASQVEEVVMDADSIDLEDLGPYFRYRPFCRSGWRHKGDFLTVPYS